MIWDVVIAYIGVTLVVTGWNVGLSRCWMTPIAMLITILFLPNIYPDFSSWLIGQTDLLPETAIFWGYILLWIVIEAILEALLGPLVPRIGNPMSKFQKITGAVIGLGKYSALIILASAASMHVQGYSIAPREPLIAIWITQSTRESILLGCLRDAAMMMPPQVSKVAIASSPPIYKPQFYRPRSNPADLLREQHYRELFKAIRQIESEAR